MGFYVYAPHDHAPGGTVVGPFPSFESAAGEAALIGGRAQPLETKAPPSKIPARYAAWVPCEECGRPKPPWKEREVESESGVQPSE